MSAAHPTKRELREQRRAQRLEAERAAATAAAMRRRRLWMLLGAAALAAVVVAVAVVVSSGSDDPAPAPEPAQASALFDGIPERDGVLGDPDAPVTVIEYLDPQCPACATSAADTLPTIVQDYVRTGKVKLEARALHFLGPDSEKAARFAAGAEAQGRLWPFLDAFYAAQGQENSGYVTDEFLRSVAAASGVDADAAFAAAGTEATQEWLNQANRDAEAAGVSSTPSFTVVRGDGAQRPLATGAQDAQTLSAALDEVLAR